MQTPEVRGRVRQVRRSLQGTQRSDGIAILCLRSGFLGEDAPFREPVHKISPHKSAYRDRKSTRLNSSHLGISYAVFCLKKWKVGLVSATQRPGPTLHQVRWAELAVRRRSGERGAIVADSRRRSYTVTEGAPFFFSGWDACRVWRSSRPARPSA